MQEIVETMQEVLTEHKRNYDPENIRDFMDTLLKEQARQLAEGNTASTFTDQQLLYTSVEVYLGEPHRSYTFHSRSVIFYIFLYWFLLLYIYSFSYNEVLAQMYNMRECFRKIRVTLLKHKNLQFFFVNLELQQQRIFPHIKEMNRGDPSGSKNGPECVVFRFGYQSEYFFSFDNRKSVVLGFEVTIW